MIHRRSLLIGLASALAAPAIVKVDSLMQLRGMRLIGAGPNSITGLDHLGRLTQESLDFSKWSQTVWREITAVTGLEVTAREIWETNEGIHVCGRLATPVYLTDPDKFVLRPGGMPPRSVYPEHLIWPTRSS